MKTLLYILFLSVVLAFQAHAEDGQSQEAIKKSITRALELYDLDGELTRIQATPFDNLYEVLLGPDVIYMSGDGRFVLKGDLLDLQEQVNITEEQRTQVRSEILDTIPAMEYIEFAPKKPDHVMYVFTDVDCAYCRRLHQDVPELNDKGIAVRYLAFPRNGVNANAGTIMQSVWCSKDRQQALTDAKNNKDIEEQKCSNPVQEQYDLGKKLGVRGTPAIYFANGKQLPGYQPPETIVEFANQ